MARLENTKLWEKLSPKSRTAVIYSFALLAIVACISLAVVSVLQHPEGSTEAEPANQRETVEIDISTVNGLKELELLADDQKQEFIKQMRDYLLAKGYSADTDVRVFDVTEDTKDGKNIYFQVIGDRSYHVCTYIPDGESEYNFGEYTGTIKGVNDSPTVADTTGGEEVPLYDHQTLRQWFGDDAVKLNEAFTTSLTTLQLEIQPESAHLLRSSVEPSGGTTHFMVEYKDPQGTSGAVNGIYDQNANTFNFEK